MRNGASSGESIGDKFLESVNGKDIFQRVVPMGSSCVRTFLLLLLLVIC